MSSFRATFYELSRHSFTQIVEPSSGDSFDSHTTPSTQYLAL